MKYKSTHILSLKSVFLMLCVNLSISQSYSSPFEEEIFEQYEKDSLNYDFFKSLASIDSLSTNILATQLQSKVLSVIKKFPEKEANSKKEKKRIKLIYDEIHKIFLKKYVLDSYFNDMFKDGTYIALQPLHYIHMFLMN